MKKTIIYAGLFLAMLIMCNNHLYAQKKKAPKTSKKYDDDGIKTFSVEGDPTDSTKQNIFLYKDGKKYVIKTDNEKISELYIDDKKMPDSAFAEYELMVKKIMLQLKQDREQANRDRLQAEIDRQQADKDRLQAEKDLRQAEEDRMLAEKDMLKAELDKKLAEEQVILADKMKEEVTLLNKRQMEQDKKQAEADYKQAVIDKKQAIVDKRQAEADAKQALLDKKQAEEDKLTLQSMIKDLVTAKVIANEKELTSLYLTKGVLIVNDKKQPDQLHEQFKTQYLKNKNRQINYSSGNGSSRYSSITTDDK